MNTATADETFALAQADGEALPMALAAATAEAAATPTITEPKPEAPWGWGERFHMPLFKPGTRVRKGGQWETVSHVTLRRDQLFVHLVGHDVMVSPADLELAPTEFTTLRVGSLR